MPAIINCRMALIDLFVGEWGKGPRGRGLNKGRPLNLRLGGGEFPEIQ